MSAANKFLVVDDEISADSLVKRDFVKDICKPELVAEFAKDCQDAVEKLTSLPNLLFCIVDCRLPLNSEHANGYQPEIGESHGLSLIPTINSINTDLPIIIFSAYFSRSHLSDELDRLVKTYKCKNVIGCLSKSETSTSLKDRLDRLLTKIDLTSTISPLEIVQAEAKKDIIVATDSPLFGLEKDKLEYIRVRSEEINNLLKKTTENVFFIGKYLAEVKEQLDYGQYEDWLRKEFDWSLTSATRFVQVYKRLTSIKDFKLEDLRKSSILLSVLYEASAINVPKAATVEIMELTKEEPVSIKQAKSIIKKHKNSVDRDKAPETTISNEIKSRHTLKAPEAPKNQILKVIPRPAEIWQVGNHTVCCCDPNSKKFLDLLPKEVAIALIFAPSLDWQFVYKGSNSQISFYHNYSNLSKSSILDLIQNGVETFTREKETLIACFIAHEQMLNLFDSMDCHAYIADPDMDKCLKLVQQYNG